MKLRNVLILLFAIVAIGSCAKDPFSTRDNELPTTKQGTFIPPTAPSTVFLGLTLVISLCLPKRLTHIYANVSVPHAQI